MNCPVCTTALVATDRDGIEIDHCPRCRGVWLDRGELEKIITRAAQPFTPSSYGAQGQGGTSYGPTGQGGHSSHTGGQGGYPAGQGGYPASPGSYSGGQGGYSGGYGHSSGHHGSHSHGHKPHKKHDTFLEQVFDIFD